MESLIANTFPADVLEQDKLTVVKVDIPGKLESRL